MKIFVLFVCVALQILITTSTVIPNNLPQPCSKSVPNYNECTANFLKKMGPYFLKGIPEINFPKLTPLHVPLIVVNRTINEFVRVSAVIKNLQIWGFETMQLHSFKFNTNTLDGEAHVILPFFRASTEYDVTGRLLTIDVNSIGYCKGNFSNTNLVVKFSLKLIKKLGVNYYTFENYKVESLMETGQISLISKIPEHQYAADLIQNFVNEDPKRTRDAVQPVSQEATELLSKFVAEQILEAVPAEELIPE